MSMTRGPIDPPITGRSIDFPVSLSVSVIVPVTMLSPSIDPPLSLSLPAVACAVQNRPPANAWQTRPSTRRSSCVGDPPQALLTPQNLHHAKNSRRGERPGQRGTQRLSNRAELHISLLGKGADRVFEAVRGPLGAAQQLGQISQ